MEIFYTICVITYLWFVAKGMRLSIIESSVPLGPIAIELLSIVLAIASPLLIVAIFGGMLLDAIFSRQKKPKA